MAEVIRLEKIHFRWPRSRTGLGEISGVVQEGTWLALIGPNGAGKTTLLRLMAGLERPSEGTIRLWDRPLSSYRVEERASQIAMVPQILAKTFDLRVQTVVELGRIGRYRWWERMGRLRGAHALAVERAMHATGTDEMADRVFTELSGGESKRVLLAMALAQETPVLLLDEPTAYLDPGHARDLLERVQALVRDLKKTVIMAYHDLSTVGLYCDQIWAMERGKIVLAGSARQTLTDPKLDALFGLEFLTMDHPTKNRPMLLLP